MEGSIDLLGVQQLKIEPQEEMIADSEPSAASVAALVEAHFRCSYLDDAPEELTCPICTEPALEALELCDEHLICAACVPVIAKRTTCPVCHVQLPTDGEGARVLSPPGRRIVRMLEKLSVACPLGPCAWSGPRGNLRDHLRISCGHVPCPLAENGCAFKGTATAVLQHVSRGCEEVPMSECPSGMTEAQEPKPQPQISRVEVEVVAEEERLQARAALVQAALAAMVDTDVVTLLVQDRRFSVSRHHLLHAQCRGSVLEALGKNDRAEFRIDCGEREFLMVLSWLRYGLVPMQASMTESEWAELLALAAALCLDGLERALRSPSRSAVTALAAAKGMTAILRGYDLSGISLACPLTHADFSGSNLSGSQLACNLSHATLRGCDLSDSDLSGSVLSRTDFASSDLQRITLTGDVHYVTFRDCDLRGADLSKAAVAYSDFSGAQLEGCKLPHSLQNCDFSRCDFRARKFVGYNFEGCDFSAVVLEGTAFMKCKLAGTRGWLDLTRTTFAACQMPGLDLSGIDVSGSDLSSNAMTEVNFSKALLHNTTLPRDLTGVRFIGAQLAGANFQGRDCTSADFSRANLSYSNLDGTNLSNANLSDCDLSGADLTGAAWPGADLSRANLSGLKGFPHNCTGTRLPGADLHGRDLGGHRLTGAVLDGANLSGCRLDYADFEKASLKLASLDGSSLECANFSGANLTGASILTDISKAKWGRYTTVVRGVALRSPIPRQLREVFSPSRMAL